MQTEPGPYESVNASASPRLIFVCDHAANVLPSVYGTLGLRESLFQTHIAFDIGAGDVTHVLAAAFDAPAILGTYSRLLIDLNRGLDDPTLVMKLSDGAIIPGNEKIRPSEIETRVARYYRPYHEAIEAEIERAGTLGITPTLISIHSFTPEWRGTQRPWQIGVLWSRRDGRLALPVLEALRREPDLTVGDNQPYSGELENDCMSQHAVARGLPHVLLEIRQDLIADRAGAVFWAERLVPILRTALGRLDSRQQGESAT